MDQRCFLHKIDIVDSITLDRILVQCGIIEIDVGINIFRSKCAIEICYYGAGDGVHIVVELFGGPRNVEEEHCRM